MFLRTASAVTLHVLLKSIRYSAQFCVFTLLLRCKLTLDENKRKEVTMETKVALGFLRQSLHSVKCHDMRTDAVQLMVAIMRHLF